MEHNLIFFKIKFQLTPDGKRSSIKSETEENQNKPAKTNEEDFFEFLRKTQSKRMDDQRCTLKAPGSINKDIIRKPLVPQNNNNAIQKDNRNSLLEMIADLQSERMDEQRAALPGFVNRNLSNINNTTTTTTTTGNSVNTPAPDDAFLDMLMRCQGSRIEEQRSELPRGGIVDQESGESSNTNRVTNIGATVPDEDFFSLIMRVQGGRMEDQRAAIPLQDNRNNVQSALNSLNNDHKSSSKKGK